MLAADEQADVSASEVLSALDDLAAPLHIRAGASSFEAVARLNQHLFKTLGFAGDSEDYYAPHNSFVNRVIARRKGLPIALSVIYIEVGRRAGVPLRGVGFPGHFLVSTLATEDDPRFFVDPFHMGRVHTEDELLARLSQMPVPPEQYAACMAPATTQQIVLRMSFNLKGSYLSLRALPDAIRQIDRVLALDPDRAEEHRDRGLLLAEEGRGDEASDSLRRYLQARPHADDRAIILEVLGQLEE